MNLLNKLREKPFYLPDKDVAWVRDTLGAMTEEEKIGQLFCVVAYTNDEETLLSFAKKYKVGGVMGRPQGMAETCETVSLLQRESRIPMLIAANFEAGGDGLVREGTCVGPNMQVAAAGGPPFAAMQGEVCAVEGAAVGANWAFAPVIDIDRNFRNPITATRTYGSHMEMVRDCGVAYTKAAQERGMAVSIKHFPGDGVDERDQHLVTSVNSLSCEEWDESYGKVYRAGIDAGALTVMVGHIMQPEWSKRLAPGIPDSEILPASLAPELLNGLLRGRLGFNGMIVSDATTMAGMCIPLPRDRMVPACIAAGCDMFLFTKNMDEDYQYMTAGVRNGTITPERLEEAVTRILAVKAALGLHEKQAEGGLIPDIEAAKKTLGCEKHRAMERECANRSVTLVKNLDGLLPLTPGKYKRVLLCPIVPTGAHFFDPAASEMPGLVKAALENEGFEVDVFAAKDTTEGRLARYSDVAERYDLIVYAANLSTKSNQTTVRIEWEYPMGANCPVYLNSVPTLFISFANPYHLLDAPRIRTFINAYKFKPANLAAVMDKLMGRSEFEGISPVDPFVGLWDTRL